MNAHHAVVWLDHNEARIFKFKGEAEIEKIDLHGTAHRHLHNRHVISGRRMEDHEYLREVLAALADAEEFLVCGPGTAKLDLVKEVHKHQPALEPKMVGVETVDHPTDGQLIAYARRYFVSHDALR